MEEQLELEKVAEQYRRDGYEVVVHPKGTDLPPFLDKFPPDLIARKQNESVVVGVVPKERLSTDHALAFLAAKVNAQPGWRFDLFVTNHEMWPDDIPNDAEERTPSEIRSLAESAERLAALGELQAACLVAGSAVEAAMRYAALRQAISLESKSARFVLDTLYSQGVLSREEHEELGSVMRIRNAVAHGLRAPELGPQHPAYLIEAAERLLDYRAPGSQRKLRRAGAPT